jgi:hypothetical protein
MRGFYFALSEKAKNHIDQTVESALLILPLSIITAKNNKYHSEIAECCRIGR